MFNRNFEDHGYNEQNMEEGWKKKDLKRKRSTSNSQQHGTNTRLLSPPPFFDLDVFNNIDPQEDSEVSSYLQNSNNDDDGESIFDFDWRSFLREDLDTLPPSNWEEEFSEYYATVVDNWQSNMSLDLISEEPDDKERWEIPWHPFDPDFSILQRLGDPSNGYSDQSKTCFGVVSISYMARDKSSLLNLEQVHNARIKLLPCAVRLLKSVQQAQYNSETFREQGIYLFELCCEDDGKKFFVRPPEAEAQYQMAIPDNNIAILNQDTSSAMSEIMSFCTYEAYSACDQWSPLLKEVSQIEKNTYLFVDIVLYGEKQLCSKVGDIFTSRKIYLQEPDYWKPGWSYNNPHFWDLSKIVSDTPTRHLQVNPQFLSLQFDGPTKLSEMEKVASAESIRQKISTAFKNMTRAQKLERISGNVGIRTQLKPQATRNSR
jgi:hypothetical protein